VPVFEDEDDDDEQPGVNIIEKHTMTSKRKAFLQAVFSIKNSFIRGVMRWFLAFHKYCSENAEKTLGIYWGC
jgi:hypothetical protein